MSERVRTRQGLERKHGSGKVSEIESRFQEHIQNKYPELAGQQDYLQKYHMNDVKAHNSDSHENTMVRIANEEGWL